MTSKDQNKTKAQLVEELKVLRKKLAKAESAGPGDATISELKRINDQLQISISNMPVGYILWDEKYRIIEWNQGAENTFGFKRDEIIGKSGLESIVPKEAHNLVADVIDRLFQGKKATYSEEGNNIKKDGTVISCIWSNIPLLDANGKVFAVMSMTEDVTERFRAAKALKESEAKYLDLYDNAPDMFASVDAKTGNILQCNQTMVDALGYTKDDIIGRSIYDLYHPDSLENVKKHFQSFQKTGKVNNAEFQFQRKDGSKIDVILNASAVRDENGEIISSRSIVRDITERKKLESKLFEAQKLESLGILAGGIAHDFNNLLMGILGNADLALLDLSPASPVRDLIKDISTGAIRAAELCKQMLAYSGRGKFIVEPLNMTSLVEEMAHLVKASISKNAILNLKLYPKMPAIAADATQIRQVVMNLLINASEAIGDKSGVITVSTGVMECSKKYLSEVYFSDDTPEGLYAYIEVSDTGSGMDEDTQSKIFDPFFTTKFTGRGLGLAAVLGIVRGHDGAIKVYSEPGQGTTIKIIFPVMEQPEADRADEKRKRDGWSGSGTVLLVDDDDTVIAVGKRMLEKIGFKVITAEDGREAIRVFREQPDKFDLIILDMTMPHMGGEETFREIRQIDKDTIVILSSGYNEQEATSRFVGKGLAGFLQKPYQFETLNEKIREVLGKKNNK